jgi:hypothetical protein
MDPEKLMEALSKELHDNLEMMHRADSVEEKLRYSEIVRNLSESLGVFLRLISDVMDADFDDDYDEYEE